ncbi:hypothetical protein CPB84DRAFT_271458 [Gymnopilus junonius]|uniref:Uncharacterized protein n=1 Tax=Gymnopilus junonius TaxID=109634 RepID=A0A9P5NXY1_GYMJU|nr:hypothetical protein CPB84DRAFT_271458 [Gymnopilus junonius]
MVACMACCSSLISSFSSSSVMETLQMALQNAFQVWCCVPTRSFRAQGIVLHMVGIRRPLSSFSAIERRSNLSAQTTCENSSTPSTFTLFPKLSSFNTVAENNVCCSSTVFSIISFSGHFFSNATLKCSQVSFSSTAKPFHHVFAAHPDFNHNSKVWTLSPSVRFGFTRELCSTPLMKSCGFSPSIFHRPKTYASHDFQTCLQ